MAALSLPWKLVIAGGSGVAGFFVLKLTNDALGTLPQLINPRSLPMTFESTKVGFIQTLEAALLAARPELTLTVRQLVIAHAAYESGWGKGLAARRYNYWNLTAGSAWQGDVIVGGDTEYTPGATAAKAISQKFRAYPDAQAAVRNYFMFLSSQRYSDGLRKLLNGDRSFVVDLGANRLGADGKTAVPAWPGQLKGGFYTLPIERYQAGFETVLGDVVSLTSALAGFPPGSMH